MVEKLLGQPFTPGHAYTVELPPLAAPDVLYRIVRVSISGEMEDNARVVNPGDTIQVNSRDQATVRVFVQDVSEEEGEMPEKSFRFVTGEDIPVVKPYGRITASWTIRL